MLAKERQNMIVDIVNRDGSVLVKDLSEKFQVTEDSIRKDLSLLEKSNLLKKTYGGAVKVRVNNHELLVSQRRDKNIEEKTLIASKAFKLIKEGDVIFLDISTINIQLIKLIIEADKNITVVTNMIDVMLGFTSPTNTKLIFIGGTLNRGLNGFVGELTSKQIEEFKFDIAFMGVVGVDIEKNSVYTYAVDDALTKKTSVEHANKAYILMESDKFLIDGNYRYAAVDDFQGIILDKPTEDINSKVNNSQIEIIY